MSSKKFCTFLAIIICSNAFAQIDTIQIAYEFRLKLFDIPTTQTAFLYHSDGKSIFTHSKGKTGTIYMSANGKIWDPDASDDLPPALDGWYQDTIGAIFYKDLKAKKLSMREFFEKQAYITEEPKLPQIKWKLHNEEKTIGKYKCQKASARFRGRSYTAWFTKEIPIADGPWKFHGLPGLIIQVYDEQVEVKYSLISIEKPAKTKVTIAPPPAVGKKVPFSTYKKAEDIEFEKVRQELEANNARRTDGGSSGIERGKINPVEREYEQ